MFTDIAILRPTVLSSVPQVWNVLYKRFEKDLLRALVDDGLEPSIAKCSTEDQYTQVLRHTMREWYPVLGGRLRVRRAANRVLIAEACVVRVL